MEIDTYSGALSSQSDHREDKTQSVTQTRRPDQSVVQPSISAETPMDDLNKDDGMEIEVYSEESANSSRETEHKPLSQEGTTNPGDESSPEPENTNHPTDQTSSTVQAGSRKRKQQAKRKGAWNKKRTQEPS